MGAARKLEYYDDYKEVNTLQVPKRKSKPKSHSKNSIQIRRKRMSLRVFMVSIIGFLLYTNQVCQKDMADINSKIMDMDSDIVEKQRDLMALETKDQAIKSQIDIVEEATKKLGLTYPEEHQIVYFQIDDEIEERDSSLNKVYSVFTGRVD